MKIITLITFILLLTSCAKKEGTSKTNMLITSATVGGVSFSGSMAIWGESDQGDKFTLTLGTSAAGEPVDIKNGKWVFHIIGWNGANALEGSSKCARVEKELSGGDAEVNITLLESNCATSTFSQPSFMTGNVFNPVDIIGCFSPSALNGSSICDNSNKANISSVKVKISPNNQGAVFNNLNSIVSECFTELSATSGTHQTNLNLPLGSGASFPFDIEIETFTDTGCSNFSQSFNLEKDIEISSAFHETYSNAGRTKIFLKSANQGSAGQPTPTSMTMTAPASSPGNASSPIFTVGGLVSGNDIIIYSDNTCSTAVSSTVTSAGTTHSVTLNTLPGDGVYSLYAQQNLGAVYSLCSPLLATYELDLTSPVDNTANAQFGQTHTNNPATINVNWTAFTDTNLSEYRVHSYTDISCSVGHQDHFGTGSTTPSTTISGLSDGEYWVTIEANDAAGNLTNSACSTSSIIVDTVSPVDIGANLQFTNVYNITGNDLDVSWTAFTDTYLYDHQVITYNDSGCTVGEVIHPNTGTSANTDNTSIDGLSDGTYYAKVRAFDEAGNFTDSGCSTDSIIVDLTAPTDNVANPQFTAPTDIDGNSIDITWTAFTDLNAIADHRILTYTDASCSTGQVDHGLTSSTLNSNNTIVNGLADGTYWVKVKAYDSAGNNTISSCSTDSIIVDTMAPIDNVANLQFTLDYYNSTNNIDVNWTSFSDSNLTNHRLYTYTDSGCSGGEIDHGLTGNTSNSDNIIIGGLSEGQYWAKVKAIDIVGNETTSVCSTDSIVIDTTPPVATLVTPPVFTEIVFTSGSSVHAKWEAFSDTNLEEYIFEVHNGPNCAGYLGDYPTGTTLTSGNILTSLTNGDYSFKIIARDFAGNQSTTGCSKGVSRVDTGYTPSAWSIFLNGSEISSPLNLKKHRAYFDKVSDKIFLFGGAMTDGNHVAANLLRSSPGSGWTLFSTLATPQALSGEGSVFYESPTLEICTYGGYQNAALLATNKGVCFNDAGPTNTISATGAPSPRMYHSMTKAHPADKDFCVWGGFTDNSGTVPTNTGACNIGGGWGADISSGAPTARGGHTSIWTGQKICIWGGGTDISATTTHGDGACFDPQSPTWVPMTNTGAPSPRMLHSTVWTGRFMCVYGGIGDGGTPHTDGGCYDTLLDSWITIPAPTNIPGAIGHSAIWTGARYCIVGGQNTINGPTQAYGDCFSPYLGNWQPMDNTNFPDGTDGAGYFDGENFCIHGGVTSGATPTTNETKCSNLR